MKKKILNWIKKYKMKLIISFICAVITIFLVVKGMNIIAVIIASLFGVSLSAKKILKKNNDLDIEKEEKINNLKNKRKESDEKINSLRGNDLANDVNNKYKKYKSKRTE